MAMTHAQHPGRTIARARLRRLLSWPLVTAAVVYLLMLAFGNRLLNDADTYWHVAVGQWIVAHHQVPHVDTFSATMAGKHWITSEWLSEVLYAEVHALLGWNGVVILAALSIAAAFGLLMRFLLERLAPLPAVALVTAAFMLASPHLLARPHVLAMPVMVAWVAGLVRAIDERRPPSFLLLPLMTLWANLHGGFTFGLFLIAPVALEALLQAAPSQRLAVVLRWALFGVLAVIAACITPYGPESILVTRRIFDLGPAMALITEWRPPDFTTLTGFTVCLLAGIGFALYRGLTLPPVRILVLLGLLYMALSGVRYGELLGLLAPLFMAAPLASQLGERQAPEQGDRTGRLLTSLVLVLSLAGITAATAAVSDFHPRAAATPKAAVAAIEKSGRHHILNSYDFGGYLIASGIKPFIDGRAELYGRDFMLRENRAVTLEDVGAFFDLLRRYDIDVTLFAPDSPAVSLLDHLKGWKRIYADQIAVVHEKVSDTDAIDGAKP